MVRLRSLVLDTRVVVVDVMAGLGGREMETEGEETETETDGGDADRMSVDGEEGGGVGMEVAKVYESTIEQLNLALGGDGFDATSG